jgi:hypothetical protein
MLAVIPADADDLARPLGPRPAEFRNIHSARERIVEPQI